VTTDQEFLEIREIEEGGNGILNIDDQRRRAWWEDIQRIRNREQSPQVGRATRVRWDKGMKPPEPHCAWGVRDSI